MAELDLALVLQAELEGSLENLLHNRSCYITYEHADAIGTNLVDSPTRALSVLSFVWSPADGAEQDALRSLTRIEIVDAQCSGLVCLSLSLLHTCIVESDELVHDDLE